MSAEEKQRYEANPQDLSYTISTESLILILSRFQIRLLSPILLIYQGYMFLLIHSDLSLPTTLILACLLDKLLH